MEKDKNEVRKELEQLSPFLLNMQEKGDGLQVPPKYFEKMQQEVLEQIRAEKAFGRPSAGRDARGWMASWVEILFQPSVRLALAATLVLAVALGWFWIRQPASPSPAAFQDLSYQEMERFLSANLDELDLDVLVSVASETKTSMGLFPSSAFSEEEFDHYMDEILDEIDLETLEDLL